MAGHDGVAPDRAHAALTIASPAAPPAAGSRHFEITEWKEFDAEIVYHEGPVTVTRESIYFDGERFAKPAADVMVAATPRLRRPVAAYMDGAVPRFRDLAGSRDLALGIGCEEIMLGGGQFYVKQSENVFAVEFVELRDNILLGVRPVANVMIKSTRLFEGLAIQNLLGAYYASIPSPRGACSQVRLPELDGHRIIDAKLYRNVLVAVGARGGRYDKIVFRFDDDFGAYDSRVLPGVPSTDINFTVLEGGVVLHAVGEGALEVFSRHRGSPDIRTFQDSSIGGDDRLFHSGRQALAARGSKLYKFTMRR